MRNSKPTLAAAALAAAMAITTAATAATFHVAENGDDDNPGTSWFAPFATVTKALEAAAENHPEELDQIWVRQGTYYPTTNPADRSASFTITDAHNNVQIYGGFPANHLSPGLDDRDPTLYPTVLSGDVDGNDDLDVGNSHTVVTIGEPYSGVGSVATTDVRLDGFTVTGGYNILTSGEDRLGGGLRVSFASGVRIDNCIVTGNHCEHGGGGAAIISANGLIVRTTFSDNDAASGAGVYASTASIGAAPEPNFVNCIFANNAATGRGGAMYVTGESVGGTHPTLTNCLLHSNTASNVDEGVAIALDADTGSDVLVTSDPAALDHR